jgi:peptidoglycan/LPS O-acetylase OafA/YrhL
MRFYMDRFFRLGPALILVVGLVLPVHYYYGHDMANTRGYALLALFSLNNWPSLRPQPWDLGPWGNTWSLACEEQFYIIWAIVLPLIMARRTSLRVLILGGITSFLLSIRIYTSMYDTIFWGGDWQFGLWSNVWKMVVGASLRLVPVPKWFMYRSSAYIGLLGIAAVLAATFLPEPRYEVITPNWSNHLIPTEALTNIVSAGFTVLLLCGISGEGGSLAILELHPLRFLGRISYSWYLWQIPILLLNGWKREYPAVGDTAIAFIVSTCSTVYVEEPINNAYKRWKARRDARSPVSIA